MKKRIFFLVFVVLFLVLALNFISAETCCIEPLEGKWCQDDLPDNECSPGSQISTTCATYTPCKKGTCVSEVSGECSSGVYKVYCESKGDEWYDQPKDNVVVNGVNVCRKGCCFYGDSTDFVKYVECKVIATTYNVNVNFDASITDEAICTGLSSGNEEVACVLENGYSRNCVRMSKQDCLGVGGSPSRADLLCTAPQLATDCAKSKETTCLRGKVYFTDTCGNIANIYDKSMYSENLNGWNSLMKDYWTYIKKPSESCEIDSNKGFSSSCGNCDEIQGTICRSYDEAKQNKANNGIEKPNVGNNVCASMDCYYDTDDNSFTQEKLYLHGERWCAETKGTLHHIGITGETAKFTNATRETLTNFQVGVSENNFKQTFQDSYNDYNLPGSRYTMLSCIDGKVYEDSCADFRQEICMESTMGSETGNFKNAKCIENNFDSCMDRGDKTSCEEDLFCKWIYGYRFDNQKVNTIHDRDEENQGSCVPLFAPGLKLRYSEGEEIPEESICSLASFGEVVKYETAWTRIRDNFLDRPLCDTSGLDKNFDHTSDCADNCYIIPTYGRQEYNEAYFKIEELLNLHKGRRVLGENLGETCLSERKAYYCEDKVGPVIGSQADCAKKEDLRKEMPLFFRHDGWMYSIKDRARSLGDCGYKPGIFMENLEDLDSDLESVFAIYKTIKASGSEKKTFDVQKVYERDFELVEDFYSTI